MTYEAYPEIEIPAFLEAPGWGDNSWHNDVVPNSLYEIDASTQECLRVWVAELDPAQREAPDFPRFMVEHVRNEDEYNTGTAPKLYVGESEEEAAAAIAKLLESRR
jgi:hypothetical protein